MCCVVCLLIGFSVGWLVGHSRSATPAERKVVSDYRKITREFHISDGDVANMATNLPQLVRDIRRDDDYAALLALGVFERLQTHREQDAEAACAKVIGLYYNKWSTNGGLGDVIGKADELAAKYPLLDAAIETNTIAVTNSIGN